MIKLRNILFPTDYSELSKHALTYVRSFAESYKADVHILHVVDEAYQYWMAMGPNMMPVGPPPEDLVELGKKESARFVAEHFADSKFAIHQAVVLGRPFIEIVRYARDNNVDLIILGTHGRSGLKHALLGSVAERVVRKAPCPVMTIRDPGHEFVLP
jgi:nucleotide-binding universal stress UspA family protein